MKNSDLSPARRARLVAIPEFSGARGRMPPPIPPTLNLSGVLGSLHQAHEALATLQTLSATISNIDMVMWALDRREAVYSSQIEGTKTNIGDLFQYERTHDSTGLPNDVRDNLNYVVAQEEGIAAIKKAGSTEGFDLDLVCRLHRILMLDNTDYVDQPGVLRDRQNWIGGFDIYNARFVPPPADAVAGLMQDLVSYLRYQPDPDGHGAISVVLRAAIAHVQFETIHPFTDGNGRIGRMLIPMMLVAEGYPPVYMAGYLKHRQQDYYRYLSGVQLRDEWLEWIRFFAEGVAISVQQAEKIILALLGLREKWLQRLSSLRKDAAAYRTVDIIIGHPVINAGFLAKKLDVSFPAASKAIQQLEQHKILFKIGDGARNRQYRAKSVIRILSRQE